MWFILLPLMYPMYRIIILKAEKGDQYANIIPSQTGSLQISFGPEPKSVKHNLLTCFPQYQLS